MFHSQSLCDVHFFFKRGISIGAHVVVFQLAGSPVFNVMLCSSTSFSNLLVRKAPKMGKNQAADKYDS
jgi:hypothetical protein